LENCRRVIDKKTRLLLVERILPDELETSAVHQAAVRSDLTMLVAHAAQERTEADFRDLLNSAGFKITRILQAGSTFNIIEAFPL
jgi:hypothetical protein